LAFFRRGRKKAEGEKKMGTEPYEPGSFPLLRLSGKEKESVGKDLTRGRKGEFYL